MKTLSLMAALVLGAAMPACAETLLNPLFQDHAVLQRGTPLRIWGSAAANATVTVSIAGQSAEAHAAADGHWQATLPAMQAGGPYVLTAKTDGGAAQTVNDVLVGDVYLCSGQSNMAFGVMGAIDAGPDIQTSANDSIRLLTVDDVTSVTPLSVFSKPVAWTPAAPQSVVRFSAACYFFGRDLQKTVKVPIGLIHDSWAGANITSFMSADALRKAGGNDVRLDALAAYAADPVKGMAHWGEVIENYWRSQNSEYWRTPTPDWPLAPKDLGIWTEWSDPQLAHYVGHVWFRTSVTLTPEQAAQEAQISLGTVTEEDQTWINGKFIASTFGYGQPREYKLPAGTLHAGANDILINDFCGWRGCGLFGPPEARKLVFKDGNAAPLSGPWHYKVAPHTASPRVPWGATAGLTVAYNAMIAPLAPYNFKGVLWYQGESNTDQPEAYRGLLKAWMADWRGLFQANLPFLIVQLPDYGLPPFKPEKSDWARLRESQRLAVKDDSNAALIVTIDIGDHMGLHPANKQEVGRRLALAARRIVYRDSAVKSGPLPTSATRGRGGITVGFTGVEGKLEAVNAAQPIGFELCGAAANSCRFVAATIRGNAVTLAVPRGLRPTRVRYCWGDGPVCTLYDAARIPAVPFELSLAK